MNPITKLIAVVIAGLLIATIVTVSVLVILNTGTAHAAPVHYAASLYAARGGNHGRGHH